MSFKFEPWNGFYPPKEPHKLDIEDPPCKHCKYWSPQVIFYPHIKGSKFDSVKLCWNEGEQHCDFSCYIPKEDS